MTKGLLLLDVQKGMVNFERHENQIKKIQLLVEMFQKQRLPIIYTKHIDKRVGSPIEYGTEGADILDSIYTETGYVIEKTFANPFCDTSLSRMLEKNKVSELVIAGFNAEYCCLFSAIVAHDRGYKVTYIEDATGTSNDATTYEMPGLDIVDFVGCVLNWSDMVEVLYYDEFMSRENR